MIVRNRYPPLLILASYSTVAWSNSNPKPKANTRICGFYNINEKISSISAILPSVNMNQIVSDDLGDYCSASLRALNRKVLPILPSSSFTSFSNCYSTGSEIF